MSAVALKNSQRKVSGLGHLHSSKGFCSIEEVYQSYLEHVCRSTGWPVGHVYLPVSTFPPELVSGPSWVLRPPEKFELLRQVTKALRFTKGVGLPGQVFLSKNPVWVSDIRENPGFTRAKLALEMGLHACFDFPVKAESEVIAVLEFFSEVVEKPDRLLLDEMEKLTDKLGLEVERLCKTGALPSSHSFSNLREAELMQ